MYEVDRLAPEFPNTLVETPSSGLSYKNLIWAPIVACKQQGRTSSLSKDPDRRDLTTCCDKNCRVHSGWEGPRKYTRPGLLLVCRQVYAEAGLVAFRNHTFSFFWAKTFQGWMETLATTQAASLRNIRLMAAKETFFPYNLEQNILQEWETAIRYMLSRVQGVTVIELDLDDIEVTSDEDDIPGSLMKIVQLPLGSATITMRRNQEILASVLGTKDNVPMVLMGSGKKANLSWLRGYLESMVMKALTTRQYQ